MAFKFFLLFCFLAFAHPAFADTSDCKCDCTGLSLRRESFPEGFLFGAGGSSYQIEGGWNVDGKGPNIWDTFTHLYPDKIKNRDNGDVAINSYYLYKGDASIAGDLGLDTYRFSISWARVLPTGQLTGGVNQLGIDYYNNLINELLAKGVEPCVTMFHWDSPQAIDTLYGGFLSPRSVEDFRDYADLLFKSFGDRVKNWVTINEAWTVGLNGYTTGAHAPGRCSFWANPNCTGGDEGIEPYLVAHHLLLAHAVSVDLYRKNYQATQGGVIGITIVGVWFLPYRAGNEDDLRAAQRQLDFMFGWFMDPVTFGDYPKSMRQILGDRLPKFSTEQSKMLIGSYDFLGLNYYTGQFAHFFPDDYVQPYPSYLTDSGVNVTSEDSEGNPCGLGPIGTSWLQVYPVGLKDLLNYTYVTYGKPRIFITENGACTNDTLNKEESLDDTVRIEYLKEHLCCVLVAIKECKVDVFGYIYWSLFDNFEWPDGFYTRFGLYYVDYKRGLERTAKKSAHWYKHAIRKSNHSPRRIRDYPSSSINNSRIHPATM